MKGIYVVKIYGERDLKLISKYLQNDLRWKDSGDLFNSFNPYISDINLGKESPIVLIFDFNTKEIEYTYPIQFDYIFAKIKRENPKVKKMQFDDFFSEIKKDFLKQNAKK